MHFPLIFLVGAAISFALSSGSAFADELQRGGNITCQGPFSKEDGRKSVMARYKSRARVAKLMGLDEEPVEGLLLFPDDPRSRLEIEEAIGTAGRVTSVNLREKNSLWTIEGLSIGMTSWDVARINGGPFSLSGFRQMSGATFATLTWLQRGDCEVVAVFKAPRGVRFEHPLHETEVRSDDPRLARLNLRVDELIFSLPEQPLK